MVTIEELRTQHQAAIDELEELDALPEAEDRGMTPEEAGRFEKLSGETTSLEKRIERKMKLDAANEFKEGLTVSNRQTGSEAATSPYQQAGRIEVPHYGGKLKCFKTNEEAYRAYKWLAGTLFSHGPSRDWCREHGMESRVMTEAVNTQGGFTVPTEVENRLIDLRLNYGVLRQEANVVPMSSDHITTPRITGGVTVYAIGETTAITASDLSLDQIELVARKWGALTYMSSDLSEDTSVSIADKVFDRMAYAMAQKEDESGVDGDGTSTYHGMVGFRTKMIDGSHGGSTSSAAGGNPTFLLLDDGDLMTLVASLPDYAHPNAKWYMSRYAWGSTVQRLLRAGGGNTIITLQADGRTFEYAGYPVVIMNAMPVTVTTLNNLVMIVFGDMAQAVSIGDRRGVTLAVDTSIRFAEDQIALRATFRNDVNVHDIGDASTAGPLVGLLGTT